MSVTNKLAAKLAKRLATTLLNTESGGTPDPSAPAFTTQPTDQTAVEGGTVTFTSLASGYPAPTYQWQRFVGSWGAISGATNRIYTFSPTGTDVDVPLRCIATNSEGTATSNECTLTALYVPLVNTVAPAVTGSATVASLLTCSTGTYTGTTPITYVYQWFADDVAIVGATSNTYTPVVGDIGAMIRCEVTATNAAGSITTSSNEVGPVAAAVTYDFYVDSVSGNDANAGTIAAPFKTIAAAQAALSAGDSLALARGSTWLETFEFAHDNLSIGVYGTGNPPVMDGRDVIEDTWTQHDAVTYPDVWRVTGWARAVTATTSFSIFSLWVNEVNPRLASSIADLQANGGFWLSNSIGNTTDIYIKSTADPNSDGKTYKATVRAWAFNGHSTSLGTAAPSNQQIVGPIEAIGFIEHYNALSGGPGTSKKLLLEDGNVHHSVTEGSLSEDIIAIGVVPGASPVMLTAYRIIGTGFSHTFRRCMVLGDSGVDRRSLQGIYGHGSTPNLLDSFAVEQCASRGASVAASSSVMTVTDMYFEESTLPCVDTSPFISQVINVNRLQIQDLTTIAPATGAMGVRCLYSDATITITNASMYITKGTCIRGNGNAIPLVVENCTLLSPIPITGGSGGNRTSLTLNNCVLVATDRSVNDVTTPYVGDFNIFNPRWGLNGATITSLGVWQSTTGQDANSVYYKNIDQITGSSDALWYGVANSLNAGPADGDFRINPTAKVYGGDNTAYFGTFADGLTPLTDAGTQEHYNWNSRSVVAGPPTRLVTLPADKAECRTYINDPAAWDFYP